MKKTTFRLQPRFQAPLENGEIQDDKDGNINDGDDTASIMSRWGWRKKRRRQSEVKQNRMRRRQNSERNFFLKTLNFAKFLLFFLCIMMMMRYQTEIAGVRGYGGEVVESGLMNGNVVDGKGAYNHKINTKDGEEEEEEEEETQTISRHAIKPLQRSRPNPSLQIPPAIDAYYADLSFVSQSQSGKSCVPVFWHILKSGGTSVKDMYGRCFKKVEAAGTGGKNDGQHEVLQIFNFVEGGIRYVNVDTSSEEGIINAIRMNLVPSGLADIIFTPLLHESAQLFNYNDESRKQPRKGQIFCLIRHPLERAVSLYHYLQKATWEPTYDERIKNIKTVEDYAISEFAENNWMTRFLANKMAGVLERIDVDIAKEILRRKVLIGLVVDVEGSVDRFNKYFDYDNNPPPTKKRQKCMDSFLKSGSNKNIHALVEEGGMAWRILRANNLFDLELYEYALQLYEEQGNLIYK